MLSFFVYFDFLLLFSPDFLLQGYPDPLIDLIHPEQWDIQHISLRLRLFTPAANPSGFLL